MVPVTRISARAKAILGLAGLLALAALFASGSGAGRPAPGAGGAAPNPQPVERHYWITLESAGGWQFVPNKIDRMTGATKPPHEQSQDDAVLVLRRYTEGWKQRDDRKVNPWDLNEPIPPAPGDPGYDQKYHGTIPGPALECRVGEPGAGEVIVVHFKNLDYRENPQLLPIAFRTHSLHPHGIAYGPEYDGSYPFSPIDLSQPLGDEEKLWRQLYPADGDDNCDFRRAFEGPDGKFYKRGDRVPPGGTFVYRWATHGWPSTAGVWLYHDHSVMDRDNVTKGAVGFLVVHNAADEDDVIDQDLPQVPGGKPDPNAPLTWKDDKGVSYFVAPPRRALYLQLYHELGRSQCVNGRQWLGNTPTLLGGTRTKMRFGLVAMAEVQIHTFHLHGHRWVLPGPPGEKAGGEAARPGAPRPVSQFADTTLFGPGNSFCFTINQGSAMGPPLANPVGEWHMHCHLLNHMGDHGMMGSLLIVSDKERYDRFFRDANVPMPEGDH
jgi:FtsP/CotA-like multicopper oxidase with cupredoxin domain